MEQIKTEEYLVRECRARWIPITEAVPAVNRRVLVATRKKHYTLEAFFIAKTGQFGKLCRLRNKRYIIIKDVEYWRLEPLHPEANQESEARLPVIIKAKDNTSCNE